MLEKTVQLQYRRQPGLPLPPVSVYVHLDFGAIKTKLTHDSAIPKLKNMIFIITAWQIWKQRNDKKF
jgi:hypothetical protein